MRINKETRAYIAEHRCLTTDGIRAVVDGEEPKSYLVADVYGIPARVESTLRRLFGAPSTIDRGETAYWVVPTAVVRECEA